MSNKIFLTLNSEPRLVYGKRY